MAMLFTELKLELNNVSLQHQIIISMPPHLLQPLSQEKWKHMLEHKERHLWQCSPRKTSNDTGHS